MLSRGARLCEAIIRAARTRPGGIRQCGRPYLARRLGCTPRTVSRYVAELRREGRLEVTPPRRARGPKGWRTIETNRYRLPRPVNHAPHVDNTHNRRSRRGDTHVTPPPSGVRAAGHPAVPAPWQDTTLTTRQRLDAYRAAIGQAS